MDAPPLAPGDRVLVFDPRLYKDDKITPPAYTFRPATVKRYYRDNNESLIDVVFDYDGRLSRGHFTWGVRRLKGIST